MSSFNTHQRRVRDESLPAPVRHTNLRSCLVHFAPYGFRATYHHLCLSARIPKDLERDPSSLVRAVQELHHARELRLADERDYANRRRAEKARGMRQAESSGSWRDTQSGTGHVAYCPHPTFHPSEPLPVVVERVLSSSVPPGEAPASTCRVCGRHDNTIAWHDGAYQLHQLCRNCGVSLGVQRADAPDPMPAARQDRQWKDIWTLRNESPRSRPG
ncbi:hypothetical protein AB0L42_37160 [Streptomyces sp. NPDC052287]|uniref:hypothetical protein n=1 Tax=unclassified Streptomyces TaxID=2593676 RepID=UPI00143E2704|nr:hypothetical protein [Streptomyces sp. RPA4-2]QIY60623.1 hypothetical protein HEP85_01595 [Streptomyces sp. RPA4-2]